MEKMDYNISDQRRQEIEQFSTTADFKDYCDTIYMSFFKLYKNQWKNKSDIPDESNSDFWSELEDDAAAKAWVSTPGAINLNTEGERMVFGKLIDDYFRSNEFQMKIKQLKINWKKEIINKDFV
jgi:hypothetical protein